MSAPKSSFLEKGEPELLRSFIHDLRAPLTVLQALSEYSMHKSQHVREKSLAVQALKSVFEVDLFLSLLSLLNGNRSYDFEIQKIENVIRKAVQWLHVQYPKLQIVISDYSEGSYCVLDERKFFQVLVALLVELIEIERKATKIYISLHTQKHMRTISVHLAEALPQYKRSIVPEKLSYRVVFVTKVLHAHHARVVWATDDTHYLPQIVLPLH